MLLHDVAAASTAVGATPKRAAKVAILADVLRRTAPAEVPAVVGFLTGEPRQGKVGVGWAAAHAVQAPPAAVPAITTAELDRTIAELAATTGEGSTARRQGALAGLFERATLEEQDFVRRLLLGELRQGALAGLMADAVARAAGVPAATVRRAAMLSGDLGGTAQVALTGGVAALGVVGMRVLHAVEPMLAGPAATVDAALADTGPASVEWKLDGARIQVHRAGDAVRVFTRNLNDVTERLPSVVAATRALAADRVVLDGEAIGIDTDARPRRFQDTMSRFGRDEGDPAGELRAFFFDVLHVDGRDLFDLPLADRLAVLDAVTPEPARMPRLTTADPDAAATMLDEALRHGHEGVMVKALDAPYEAGRRGRAWRKVKPAHTLDLVVLAAEWGHGRRTGWLSNLHLGARHPGDGSFVMVGKTFKGLTDELLRWQTAELQRLAIGAEGHVVHVRPDLVVEVALDGVQASRRYPGGVALRFARVRQYRLDKRPADADTIDSVRALLG